MKTLTTNPRLQLNKEIVAKLKIHAHKSGNYDETKRKAIAGCCDWLSFVPNSYGLHVKD